MSWTQLAKCSVVLLALRVFGAFCQRLGRCLAELRAFPAWFKCLSWPTGRFCRCALGCKGDFDSTSLNSIELVRLILIAPLTGQMIALATDVKASSILDGRHQCREANEGAAREPIERFQHFGSL